MHSRGVSAYTEMLYSRGNMVLQDCGPTNLLCSIAQEPEPGARPERHAQVPQSLA